MIRNLRFKNAGVFLVALFMGLRGMAQVPVITTVLKDTTVCAGNDAVLTIAATNNPTSYQWQMDNGGGVWGNITDAAPAYFSGGSTNTLTSHTSVYFVATFRCVVSNANGSAISGTATVKAQDTDSGTSVYTNTNVCQGRSLYFFNHIKPGTSASIWSYSGTGASVTRTTDSTEVASFSDNATSGILTILDTGFCTRFSQTMPITINPMQATVAGTAGAGTICTSQNLVVQGQSFAASSSCSPISVVKPSGSNPAQNTVTSCVTVDASVETYNGIPYVQRHYNIEPAVNAATSTATLTLYFTQTDFDNYNTVRGSNPALPTGPTDTAGISNLRVTQFHGTGTDPGTYVSGSGTIDPADSNIIWNASDNRWEVTFDIVGFSGFFVSGASLITPLPLTLTDFSGQAQPDGNLLQWTTSQEENTRSFEIQRSDYGTSGTAGAGGSSSFEPIGTVAAAGNSHQPLHYSYKDAFTSDQSHTYAYRLKMTDLDGSSSYSRTIVLQPAGNNAFSLQLSPNPSHDVLTVSLVSPTQTKALLTVTDISGKKIVQENIALVKGINTFQPKSIADLHAGSYWITVIAAGQQQTVQLVKY